MSRPNILSEASFIRTLERSCQKSCLFSATQLLLLLPSPTFIKCLAQCLTLSLKNPRASNPESFMSNSQINFKIKPMNNVTPEIIVECTVKYANSEVASWKVAWCPEHFSLRRVKGSENNATLHEVNTVDGYDLWFILTTAKISTCPF